MSTQTTTTQAASGAEGFSFQQPQRNRMHDVLRRLGHAAIQSQKITDHEAANAAQRQCLGEIEALVSEALAATEPAGWTWDEVGTRLRDCSIHSIAGGEPERYLIKIGCPDIQTMQAVRDGMVHLREGTTAPQPAGAERVDLGEMERLSEAATPGGAKFEIASFRCGHECDDVDLPGSLSIGSVEIAQIHERYGGGATPFYEADGAFIAALWNAYRAGHLVPASLATARDGGTAVTAEQAAVIRDALIQARGALHIDSMTDEAGKPYGTTTVAQEAIGAALAILDAAPNRESDR